MASRVREGVATWKVTRGGVRERELKEDTVMPRGRSPSGEEEEADVQIATPCGRRRIMWRSCSPIGKGTVEGSVEECGWMLGRR
jgi:hypothetical protein